VSSDEIRARRKDFHDRLVKQNLLEGYSYDDDKDFVTRPYWPVEPKNKMRPAFWKWSEVRNLIVECGEMIGLGHGGSRYDRRVLALSNPGSEDGFTLTGPLFGDIQLIRPGEGAPSHRHTPCATRFIMEGQGGWTSVAGERVHVKPGDIVYTGQFPWHDHGNGGKDDFIFLDILDIPLLFFTGTSAWEFDFERVSGSKLDVHQKVSIVDADQHVESTFRPAYKKPHPRDSKNFGHLSWSQARERFIQSKADAGSDFDDLIFEFTTPDGEPIGTTVSVFSQWIRPQCETLSHRHTGATVYICVEGRGQVQIENEVFHFEPNDIFVIPSWHWHNFKTDEGAYLHSISDISLIDKLNLYREERRSKSGAVELSDWTQSRKAFR
jgi:gentisate 1,2-dioxygenase